MIKNLHNIKARGLKAILLRKLGRISEVKNWLDENLKVDAFDYISLAEFAEIGEEREAHLEYMNCLMRDFQENYLQAARDYAEAGCSQEAVAILEQCTKEYLMLAYYKGYYLKKWEKQKRAWKHIRKQNSILHCIVSQISWKTSWC